MYTLNKAEQKEMTEIENTYYMKPILARINDLIKSKKDGILALNKIHDILVNSKPDVEKLLEERKSEGKIKDVNQARKAIVGNAFSKVLVYLFLKNKIYGNIRPDIFITSKKSNFFQKNMFLITVGGETQKPDVDLIIYNNKNKKCIFLSLKTSLRERVSQTYKWKLLIDIATTDNQIKEKYDIKYDFSNVPFVCFATVNFYNEINNPQTRGTLKFFDKAFISKDIGNDLISPLSELIDFVNQNLGDENDVGE